MARLDRRMLSLAPFPNLRRLAAFIGIKSGPCACSRCHMVLIEAVVKKLDADNLAGEGWPPRVLERRW